MRKLTIPSRHLRATQLRYFGQGQYVDGKWEDRVVKTVNLKASIQPISGSQVNRLPEGVNPQDVIAVKMNGPVSLEAEGRRPPEIAYNGRWYALMSYFDWGHRGFVEATFQDRKSDA